MAIWLTASTLLVFVFMFGGSNLTAAGETAGALNGDGYPISAPATAPKTGTTRINSRDGLTYVWISPGSFMMGCSPGDTKCVQDEKPPHRVTLTKGFWMGQTSVTQSAYMRVMKANPSHFKGESLPVETISWVDAQSYCTAVGGRLPTEAEWEYAARAGTTGSMYGDLDAIAWYFGNSGGPRTDEMSHPVGQKKPNAWNLYDMLGNVSQWTSDWYWPYGLVGPAVTDPTGPSESTSNRTLRGSSWRLMPQASRVSTRGWWGPNNRSSSIGVRCVTE